MSVDHTKTMIIRVYEVPSARVTIWKNYPENELYIPDDIHYYSQHPELVEVQNYIEQSGWTNIYELAEHICDNTSGLYKVEVIDRNMNGISLYCQ